MSAMRQSRPESAVVIRKRISRAKLLEFFATLPACLVGIEACPTAHYWSRRLRAFDHTVRLLPPSYVKAYLKRSKNDAGVSKECPIRFGSSGRRILSVATWESLDRLLLSD